MLYYMSRWQFGGLAQLARALALHARGQGFESLILHQIVNKTQNILSFFVVYKFLKQILKIKREFKTFVVHYNWRLKL